MRHANPDLIFDHELDARVDQVLAHLRHGSPLQAPLQRVTLFLTDRCNLACRYCNGPHMACNSALHKGVCHGYLPEATFRAWLEAWAGAGLKHLHFTGGEPALHPRLAAFVAAAKAAGIPTSITSNGTLPYKTYARLLKAGLSELRISIDSAKPREVDAIVGRPGAGRRLLGNLRALLRLRAPERPGGHCRRDFWLVLNSCLDRYDARELYRRLASLRRLGPDDIKVLVIAQSREALRLAARRDTVDKLKRVVAGWGNYPLLQRKLQDMFRRDAAGLRDPVVRQVAQRCVVPLLERTQDENGLYPCSIYKRHAGAPIIAASAPLAQQQRAIQAWTQTHDCRQDPICIQHCVGCTRQLNVKANLALQGRSLAPTADGPQAGLNAQPWLVVKPLGLPHLRGILRHLRAQGATVQSATPLAQWQSLAARLHAGAQGGKPALQTQAYAALEQGDEACWLQLQGPMAWGKLRRLKRELRLLFPGRQAVLQLERGLQTLQASVVHGAEEQDEARERRVLEAAQLGA